jgi:ABC-type transport system involved in Fe-S cluster assembly fused permease/ATPase subunit
LEFWDLKPISPTAYPPKLSEIGSMFYQVKGKIRLKPLKLIQVLGARILIPNIISAVLYVLGSSVFHFINDIFIFLDVAFDMKISIMIVTPIIIYYINWYNGSRWRSAIRDKLG